MDEPFTSGVGAIRDRFAELRTRLQKLLASSEETAAWFALWAPVLAAAGRLTKTLARVALGLRRVASGESSVVWTEEDRAHIAAELSAIAADFPDAAEVIFGLGHIDALIDALMADEGARTAASKTLKAMTGLLDGLIKRLVDIGLGQIESDVGPDRVVAFIERFEASAEAVFEPWVQRALGVSVSEANIEPSGDDGF